MFRVCFLLTLFLCETPQVFSQVGIGLGNTFFLGDLGGNKGIGRNSLKDINLSADPAVSLFKDLGSIRIGLGYSRISGSDNRIEGSGGSEESRYKRNLHFRSDIWEFSLHYKLNPTKNLVALPGLSTIYHTPKANLQNKWYSLQPLMLEGVKYHRIQPGVSCGIEYWVLTSSADIGINLTRRLFFTDYLDDVSRDYILHDNPIKAALSFREVTPRNYVGTQRGDPKDNDTYMTLSLMIILKKKVNTFKCPKDVY